MLYTAPKRLRKSLAEFFRADPDLVTLTGHVDDTNMRIYVYSGDNKLERNSLIIDPVSMDPWLPDVDHIWESMVYLISYASSTVTALDIMGAAAKLLMQNPNTQVDASFDLNSIRTKGIKVLRIDPFGEAMFEVTSIRRTERSDVPMPSRHVSIVTALIRWEDYAT